MRRRNLHGLRFQKRIKVFPGLHLKLSLSGIGVSAGGRGFHVGRTAARTELRERWNSWNRLECEAVRAGVADFTSATQRAADEPMAAGDGGRNVGHAVAGGNAVVRVRSHIFGVEFLPDSFCDVAQCVQVCARQSVAIGSQSCLDLAVG